MVKQELNIIKKNNSFLCRRTMPFHRKNKNAEFQQAPVTNTLSSTALFGFKSLKYSRLPKYIVLSNPNQLIAYSIDD